MGLREWVENYVISLELGEHKKVSELSSKICVKLVEILDDYLAEREDDDDDGDGTENESQNCDRDLIEAFGLICDRIRKYDDIAMAYGDVRSFVYLYDMVCFSRMVGAISPNQPGMGHEMPEHELPIDVEHLAYIMRSARFLLRYMNESEHLSTIGWPQIPSERAVWFDVDEQMDKSRSGVGFPLYRLNIVPTILAPREQQITGSLVDHLKSLCAAAAATGNDYHFSGSELGQLLASKWFDQFVGITMSQSYPLDRFSSLIALWIVADICECSNLEDMISELVDRIYHEESNSCNVEELMQLGHQVGSYWLSYHRRHRTTFAKASAEPSLLEDSDDYDDDHDEPSSLGNSSAGSEQLQGQPPEGENSRTKFRKLIRDELLEGPNCLICGSRPREPLACLRQQSKCSECLGELPQEEDFCALSRRTLPLIRLETLRQQLRGKQLLTLVSSSEWTRQMLAGACQSMLSTATALSNGRKMSEKIDIEPTFERLTIIRDDVQADDEVEEEATPNDPDEDEPSEMRSTLRAFMMSPESMGQDLAASESIRMLRFAGKNSQLGTNLYLCSSDFLILDQQNRGRLQRIQLRLMAVNSLLFFADGSLWICSSRSSISQLKLGCGRLFTSLELLRRSTTLDCFTCCFCGRELTKVSSSPANLQWPAMGEKHANLSQPFTTER